MATNETSKQRASRIPRDYHKAFDPLERWKLGLAAGAIVLALAVPALGLVVRRDSGASWYSPGPVAAVHATWNDRCEACHEPFRPINGNTWLSAWWTGRTPADYAHNIRCESCHAGPIHHVTQKPDEVAACGTCHREHRGPDASLIRMSDADCTRCHHDLSNHLASGAPKFGKVTAFARKNAHPEFKQLTKPYERTLKFNHAVHLTPGLVRVPGAKQPWKLESIADPELRRRYREQPQQKDKADTALVQLDCASCHVLDNGNFPGAREQLAGLPANALLPPRAAGAYMQPIVYENQCRACHPLDGFDDRSPRLSVPHRLQPNEVRDFLKRTYVAQFLEDNPKWLERPAPKRLRLDPPDAPPDPTVAQEIGKKVELAEKHLYLGAKTCGECHDYENDPGKVAPREIVPPRIPDVWFAHARFNHVTHRGVDCRSCHADAYPPADGKVPAEPIEKTKVLIAGIDTCRECHAPASTARGGARHDCTECHRYHNGDTPLQGLGAAARDPMHKARRQIDEFLTGAAPRARNE